MDTPHELYDATFVDLVKRAATPDLVSNESTTAMKNLETFSKCRPPALEPEPETIPEPTTFWGRTKAGTARAWDNETTRALIKAGGAFAGVGLVVYSTIHKDHVIERNAMSQANQRNS